MFATTIDTLPGAGVSSIALGSDGIPVISYVNYTIGLRVAKCVTDLCAGPATITNVDVADNLGSNSSIKVPPDGLPIVSYSDGANQRVKIAKCANAACTASSVKVLDPSGVGQTSLAIGADGFAVVVYTVLTGGFRLAKCSNATCDGISYRLLAPNYGAGTVFVGTDSLPFVAYSTAGTVRTVKCSDANCSGPLKFGYVESQSTSATQASAVVASDSLPAITYSLGNQIRFGKCQNVVCAYP